MHTAPLPPNEADRQLTLVSLNVLDTPADPVLDGLVRSAATVLGCPVSLVSLADTDRQWFKARVGLAATQIPRELSMCAYAILGNQLFEVPDATLDPRFADNPLVTGEPHLRYYAGVPLDIDGHKVGTLCVIDQRPRRLEPAQRQLLIDLARAVEHWLLSWRQHNELREAAAYRRSLFEQLGDGVLVFDHAHRVLDANPQALAMLGHGREDLLRLRRHDLLADFESQRLADQLNSVPGAGPHLAEWLHVRKDGTQFPAEVSAKPLDAQRYLAVVRDITQRHTQEQQLRQLSLAVEQSSDSIIITDQRAKIEYVNAQAASSTGYRRADMIGRNSSLLQSGKTPAQTYRALRDNLAAERPWKGLLVNKRKDGSEYVAFTSITPIRMPHGRVTHYLTVMEDVTEKQRLGEELDRHRHHLSDLVAERTAELALATKAAEAANEAKSAFLATMSHEIRTPMNGVVGIVDVLSQSSLTPYQADLADTIRESAFALLSLIDGVLDFSKIEAGRLLLESEPVALLRLVEGVCDALQPMASKRGVVIQLFVDPRLPDWISSDAVRLRQILNNLLGNAIKFSAGLERPGWIRLRVEPGAAGQLCLQVSDNGIGMTAEVRARIFQPFMQAESSTTRRYGGTGLGLSICHRLAELLGGSIEATSALGEGTTFTVALPLQADATQVPAQLPQDLTGLDCHVVLRDVGQAADWCMYLAAAGAQARCWADLQALQQALATGSAAPAVLMLEVGADDAALEHLLEAVDGLAVVEVRLGAGRSCNTLLMGPGRVLMDTTLLHRSVLLNAVALAAGRAVPEPAANPANTDPVMPVTPSVEQAAALGRLVLVAEDNDINQKVIRRQLALLGYAVEVAGDGLEALARWRAEPGQNRYGVLLTDLHMPGIDGYTLAANIRSQESPGQHLPIIALTANALHGEAERCRAVGMDDYLTKPVQLAQLGALLARWLPAVLLAVPAIRQSSDVGPAEPGVTGPLPVLDPSALAQLIGDDPIMLTEFRQDFVVAAAATASELRSAVERADWATTQALAHRLKSSSRAVGAMDLGGCCDQLEQAGKSGSADQCLDGLLRFESALELVMQRLCVPVEALWFPAADALTAEPGVLVVDDDPFQLALLVHQLDVLGVAPIRTSSSGLLALESMQHRDTSAMLILLDLNMPEMDGVELMRQLAERRYAGALALVSGADTRVLETATKLAAAYQLAVLSHLHKPVSQETLHKLIERWRRLIPAQAPENRKVYGPQEIERAIDRGELVLHYQPKVALSDGALNGVEALVRWQHPSDGLVYPDSFVAVAEAHGLIDVLTRVVLAQALAQARRWRALGLGLRVAVNISMDNLARLDFPEFVLDEIARHGVPAADLVLEVTESRLMGDARAPMDILTRLRLKQIGLSIDDFGTGHSSLAQLRDIPFDELKIDRGFVHGGAEHATQRAIFTASLEMAHQLGMKVVAEGVEDRADWDFVRAAGCDVAQGYFVARPMPAEALPGWNAQWRVRFEAL